MIKDESRYNDWYFEIKQNQVILKIQFEFLDFNGQFIGTKKPSTHKDIHFFIYQKNIKKCKLMLV